MSLRKVLKGIGVGVVLGVPLLIAAGIALFLFWYLGLVFLSHLGLLRWD